MVIKTIFCLLGLIALATGIFTFVKHYNLRKHCTAQVKGYVSFVPFEARSEKEGQLLNFVGDISKKVARGKGGFATSEAYSEVITYSIHGVEHVTPTGHVSNDTRKYSAGQNVVTVVYDPSDLKRFYILENENDRNFAIIAVILGPLFVIVSLLIP